MKTIKEITKAKKVAKKRAPKKVVTPIYDDVYIGQFSWGNESKPKMSVTYTIVLVAGILAFLAGLALLCINREILRECIAIYKSV